MQVYVLMATDLEPDPHTWVYGLYSTEESARKVAGEWGKVFGKDEDSKGYMFDHFIEGIEIE